MFNYQYDTYPRLMKLIQSLNLTDRGYREMNDVLYEKVRSAVSTIAESETVNKTVEYVKDTLVFQELSQQWHRHYPETYSWIYPKVVALSNTTLHYGTGVSVGVLASLLLLFFIFTRILPSRLKSLGYLLMLVGTSASFWLLSSVTRLITDPMTETLLDYWQYILGYCIVMGIVSFALVYRYGPVTDTRTLNLIQWFLQGIGLLLVYNSTQIPEVSIALIIMVLSIYNFPRAVFQYQPCKNMWFKLFPPKIKLLTEDEYVRQANIETKKELEKLRDFCRSPECPSWKIISKLKSPQRFADFVYNGSWHISGGEQLRHDRGDNSDDDALSDLDSDIVFVLGSQNMRVPLNL